MVAGKLGWGVTLWTAFVAPRRLFEAVKAGEVTLRRFWSYVLASAVAALGTGLELGRLLGQPALGVALGSGESARARDPAPNEIVASFVGCALVVGVVGGRAGLAGDRAAALRVGGLQGAARRARRTSTD